jgi:hypothetical protein
MTQSRDDAACAVSPMTQIIHITAKEGDNIITHLLALENLWDNINTICPKPKVEAFMTELQFKIHIASTLPSSCDPFTCSLIDNPTKQHLTPHDFIIKCIHKFEKSKSYNPTNII